MGGLAAATAAPTSPCTGVCRIDAAGDRCLGCGRTMAQIAAWPMMNEAERLRAMAALSRPR